MFNWHKKIPPGDMLAVAFALISTGLVFLFASWSSELYYERWAHGAVLSALIYGFGFQFVTFIRASSKGSWYMVLTTVVYATIFILSIALVCFMLWTGQYALDKPFHNYVEIYDKLLFVVISSLFFGADILLWVGDREKYAQQKYFAYFVDLPIWMACVIIVLFGLHFGFFSSLPQKNLVVFVYGANAFQMIVSNILFSVLLVYFATGGRAWVQPSSSSRGDSTK